MMSSDSTVETRKAINGGVILTLGTVAASGANYLLNLILGRWLTPAEFADANLMVTLMLLATAVAIGLQLVVAKFTSGDNTSEHQRVLQLMVKLSTWAGIGLGALLVLPATYWSSIFNTESGWLFVILGVTLPFFAIQSAYRGLLQGRLKFGSLASTFLVEAAVRLIASLGLVLLGFGVTGATIGLGVSFVATWAVSKYLVVKTVDLAGEVAANPLLQKQIQAFIAPTAVLLFAQIIINNGDVLVTKSSFDPTEAGIYAAVALIGRAVFFLSWSVVQAFFPVASANANDPASSAKVMRLGLAVVVGMCILMTAGVAVLGDWFLVTALGEEFAGQRNVLVGYAAATSMFAASNYLASHKLAEGSSLVAKWLVGVAILQTVLMVVMSDSSSSIVNAQLIAMGCGLVGALLLVRGQLVGRSVDQSASSAVDDAVKEAV